MPGRSIVLVRNPGWDAATDELRPAYPDRIEVSIGGNNDDLYNKIKSNDLDFVVDGAVPPDVDPGRTTTNPDLQSKINVVPVRRAPLHLVQLPDAAVRRHPRAEGVQLGVGQGRDATAPRRCDHR